MVAISAGARVCGDVGAAKVGMMDGLRFLYPSMLTARWSRVDAFPGDQPGGSTPPETIPETISETTSETNPQGARFRPQGVCGPDVDTARS